MNQQESRQHFIPFYSTPRKKQPTDRFNYHKLAWLRQRKNEILQSPLGKEKSKHLILEIEIILKQNYCQQYFIKYNPSGDEIKYTSEHEMKRKVHQCIQEEQEAERKKQKSEEETNVSPRVKALHGDRYFFLLDVICRYCKAKGHYIKNCHKLHKGQIYLGGCICFDCNQRGHTAKVILFIYLGMQKEEDAEIAIKVD